MASSQTVGFDRTSYEKIQDAIKLKKQNIAKAVAAGQGHTSVQELRQLIIEYHDLQEQAQRIRQRGQQVSGVVTAEDLGHIISEDRRGIAPRAAPDFMRRVELNKTTYQQFCHWTYDMKDL